MIIQRLLLPKKDICEEIEMYYRIVDSACVTDSVVVHAGGTLSLDTYFNAFSIGKWVKYTCIDNLKLSLELSGEVEIKGYHSIGFKDEGISDDMTEAEVAPLLHARVEETEISILKVTNGDRVNYEVSFEKLYEEGILYITVENKSDKDITLFSGAYETDIREASLRDIRLALGICTFKREEFLKKNVSIVLDSIINNVGSLLHGNVEVFVSDNGQTLPVDLFESDMVHIFPNANMGGAGGFTRTMIEALLRNQASDFSHIILMDDDIVLSPDVLERTYLFLRMIDEEHKDMMVGGEMFSLDKRYLQYEAGAKWSGTKVSFFNRYFDMRTAEAVAANEESNPINYSGWWYSVIPTSIINENNLPMPLFIHYDDMEYGSRNEGNGTILINGIAVWHPQGRNKAPVRMIYYDIRNMMIGMSALPHRATSGEVVNMLMNRVIGAVIRYNYEEAEVCFEALEDFYKGPEWFMELDPLKKHDELTRYNFKYVSPEDAGVNLNKLRNKMYKSGGKLVFLWGLLLWLLPSVRPLKVAGLDDIGLPFGAKKVFHYDADKKQGHMSVKSYGRAWKDFIRYIKVVRMIRANHDEMMDRWEAYKMELTSIGFWEKYLGI